MNPDGNEQRFVKFTDADGQKHQLLVAIDVACMMRLREYDPPIDILRLVDTDDPSKGLWAEMMADPPLAIDVIYEATRGREHAPDSPTEFAKGLAGDALDEFTKTALLAIVDFIPDPRQRQTLMALLDSTDKVMGALTERALAELDPVKLEQEVMDRLGKQAGAK